MKSIRTAAIAAALAVACGGCATLPQGTVNYYLAKTSVSVKVTRTVGCDAHKHLIIADTVSATTLHFADTDAPGQVSLEGLRSVFADTDVKFELTDDTRLKTLNGTLTGHGEEILNKIVNIAGTLAAGKALMRVQTKEKNPCAYIEKSGGDSKVLTLTYEGDIKFDQPSTQAQELKPQMSTEVYMKELGPALGTACAFVETVRVPRMPVAAIADKVVKLKARQPAVVDIAVNAGPADGGKDGCANRIATVTVPVAQKGVDYDIPLPKAPAFGKQVFAITFADSGALSSLQYATTVGTPSALNSLDSALTAASSLNSRRAEALNAEANLIAAQQRLVRCQADPSKCQ